MAQAGRTFRIFVSSTFTDLKEERNALQRDVFPRLRDLCAQHGARFQAIDLRWGVSMEAGLDQQTVSICLAEIERCQRTTPRPNFVVLLGDRYGWRPLPASIPGAKFASLESAVTDEAERSLLLEWYRRDDNAVPPVYDLLPRTGEFRDHAAWEERVERPLRSILERTGASGASATELEIERGVSSIPDAREHVFCFLREFKAAEDLPPDFVDVFPDGTLDTDARGRLERLKESLRTALPGKVHEYETAWSSHGISTDHLGPLCDDVWTALSGVILEELRRLGEAATEAELHQRFADERSAVFVGRTTILTDIAEYVGGAEGNLCAVVGAPGAGKSALMATAAGQARAADPSAVVVDRYIGASPRSSDIRDLLADLCGTISKAYRDGTPVPTEYQELATELPKRLALATAERPLVLFLDALDQLSESQDARNLVWLPGSLPEHVRVVVSTRHELLEPVRTKDPAPLLLALDRLSREEGGELLDRWLADAYRTLQPEQLAHVLDAFDRAGGLPLYLKLAFEEARLWKSYTAPEPLGADIKEVIRDNLFGRLSGEEHHGALLVQRSLAYLAASRYGLAEDELLDVLARDDDLYGQVKDQAQHDLPEADGDRTLPVVLWSRLSFDLEPYLTERLTEGASLLAFYHRELGDVAAETYLAGEAAEQRHAALAEYFRSKTDPGGDLTWTGTDPRGLSELPYHLAESGRLDDLFDTLTSFRFLERKAAEVGVVEHAGTDGQAANTYTGVFRLQDDYELALAKFGGGTARQRRPLIVTAVDFRDGDGLRVGCPWCNTRHPFEEAWRGQEIACPQCGGPLRVNPFVVGERREPA